MSKNHFEASKMIPNNHFNLVFNNFKKVQQLDGGEHGEFFADMKDYFYYAQIRSQVNSSVLT